MKKRLISLITMVAMLLSMTVISAFAETDPVTANCTDRLYVDLLNNTVSNSTKLFTQDHSTNDAYDVDLVMLTRFQIDDIQATNSISFNTLFYSSKTGVSKAEFYLADNNWTTSDTSFTSVKNGDQTLLFTSELIKNYTKDGSYYIIPVSLSAEQVSALKSRADDSGYFTILVRGICTSQRNDTGNDILSGYALSESNKAKYKTTFTYATQQASFCTKNSEKLNCTERLYVDLLKNEKITTSYNLFTQDHSTDDNYDYDKVMLVRYHISNVQDVSSMSFTTKLYSNKKTTTKAKFYLADNSWTSEDTSFTSVKDGVQTELFTSNVFNTYTKDGSYYVIPYTLSSEQVEAVKAAADEDGYFTILVRAINTTANRTDIRYTAEGHNLAAANNANAFANVLKEKNLVNLNAISAGDTIVAERYVVEGTDVEAIHAIPIIAIYDGDTWLKKVAIGSAVDLDGSVQNISAEIEVPDGIATPIVSLFMWESLDNIRPVLDMNSIRYNP